MDRRTIPVFKLDEYRRDDPGMGEFAIESMEGSFLHHPHRTQAHSHPFFQVFFTAGACSLMHDFVDYSVGPDTLIFASPGAVHTLIPVGKPSGWFLSFSQAFFDADTPPPSHLLEYPFFFQPGVRPFIPLTGDDAQWCRALFAEVLREVQQGAPGRQQVIRAYLQILFTRATRLIAPASAPEIALSRPAQLTHQYRLAVENHFTSLHALADYAALLEVTPNHLNDMVRQETGQSAGAILRDRQLLEAKRLLLHSRLSISEIAYRLQFKDPSYFSRFFRRMMGEAPGSFREEIREKYQKPDPSHP